MATSDNPAKAVLVEIKWDADQRQAEPVPGGKRVKVQFNPQSLKLTYSNENRGGDQPGGSPTQYVGSGTTKMSVELLFDTTAEGTDVRKQSEKVAYFIQAQEQSGGGQQNGENVPPRVPPGISFEWGSFIFRGIVNSMDETLDYFSEEGVPMRATIALSLSRQEIEFLFGQAGSPGRGAPGMAGATPLQPAQPGESVSQLAGRLGASAGWKDIAAANGIDDPLRLEAGALINVNAR